jgi:hypothetical protein
MSSTRSAQDQEPQSGDCNPIGLASGGIPHCPPQLGDLVESEYDIPLPWAGIEVLACEALDARCVDPPARFGKAPHPFRLNEDLTCKLLCGAALVPPRGDPFSRSYDVLPS